MMYGDMWKVFLETGDPMAYMMYRTATGDNSSGVKAEQTAKDSERPDQPTKVWS